MYVVFVVLRDVCDECPRFNFFTQITLAYATWISIWFCVFFLQYVVRFPLNVIAVWLVLSLPIVEIHVGQGHPRWETERSEVGIHAMPGSSRKALAENHMINLWTDKMISLVLEIENLNLFALLLFLCGACSWALTVIGFPNLRRDAVGCRAVGRGSVSFTFFVHFHDFLPEARLDSSFYLPSHASENTNHARPSSCWRPSTLSELWAIRRGEIRFVLASSTASCQPRSTIARYRWVRFLIWKKIIVRLDFVLKIFSSFSLTNQVTFLQQFVIPMR